MKICLLFNKWNQGFHEYFTKQKEVLSGKVQLLVLDPPYQVLEHLARGAITFHQMEEVCNIAQSVLCAGGTAVIFCGTLQMEFDMKKLKDCNLKVDPVPLVCVNSMRSNFIILYSVDSLVMHRRSGMQSTLLLLHTNLEKEENSNGTDQLDLYFNI